MAMPANVTTVVVLGTFLTPEGDPSTGTVSFTPSSWLLNSGANVAIPNSTVTKSLGTAGNFTVTLPITDDPDLNPEGWVYTVSEVVDGVSQSYNIAIPGTVAAGGTVYLADLTPVAPAGPEYYSLASSLSIGTVSSLAAGSAATATITGLAPNQILNLGIPNGATGPQGPTATLAVGTTTSVPNSGTATVTNVGSSSAGTFNFILRDGPTGPTGPTATLAVGTVSSVPNSGTASITNVGSSSAGTFDFVLRDGPTGPQGETGATGPQGPTATVAVGTTTSVTNSGTASVTNVGSSSAGTFNFVLRDGPTGPQGATGTAATVTLGTVGFVDYPGPGTITNSGTSGSAVLDFILVRGPQGAIGDLSAAAPLYYIGSEFGLNVGTGLETAGTTLAVTYGTATSALGTAAAGTANRSARQDHVHTMPSATDVGAIGTSALTTSAPAALGTAAAAGTATNVARLDHVHPYPSAANVGAVGTATQVIAGTALTGGGALTGNVTLNANLTSTAPVALGVAAAGTATTIARADHVHPTTGLIANSLVTAAGQVIASSGSATPAIVPIGTADGHVLTWSTAEATKMKWAAATGGGGGYTVGTSAPGTAVAGDRWLESDTGIEFTYFDDGTSFQWVETGAAGGPQGPTGATGAAGTSGVLASSVLSAGTTTSGTNTLTILSHTIGSATAAVGSTYRLSARGYRTGVNNSAATFAITLGTATVATLTHANSATAAGWSLDGLVTIRSIGTAATAAGQESLLYNATWLTTAGAGVSTVNSNSDLALSMTVAAASTANTYTASNAVIEQVKL